MIQSKSPYSQEVFSHFAPLTESELMNKINLSMSAFKHLRETSIVERADWLRKAGRILEDQKEALARLITLEMGKVIKESIAEVEKCAWVCHYYADHASSFLKDEIIITDGYKSLVSYQPLGPVLAVMPWNFPFWQVFRFAAPALMVGNTGLLKHASNVPQCALAIQLIFEQAGFPPGSFTTLLIESQQVESVIAHPMVKAVTLTGSEPAGASVAAIAGKYIKKSVLELGGSDPYLILKGADLDLAVPVCAGARMFNAGQSCISAKRFIVHQSLYDEFLIRFRQLLKSYEFGDPLNPSTTLAPLASSKLRDELHEQVTRSLDKGAQLVCGGVIPKMETGAFYPPTILTSVDQHNPAYTEELFGPVAVIFGFSSEDEAIEIANATKFGLGAAIFSRDVVHAERLAKTKIDAGCCFVNAQVKSDPRLPFGGIKNSGYGRELSKEGLREFANIKSIYIR